MDKNKTDENLQIFIAEASCRDLHCYFCRPTPPIMVTPGVVEPKKSEEMNPIRVKGRENNVILKYTLDVKIFRDFHPPPGDSILFVNWVYFSLIPAEKTQIIADLKKLQHNDRGFVHLVNDMVTVGRATCTGERFFAPTAKLQ